MVEATQAGPGVEGGPSHRSGRTWFASRMAMRALAAFVVVVGGALGTLWFVTVLHAPPRLLVRYVFASVTSAPEAAALQDAFRGRPVAFLVGQWLFRVAAVVAVLFVGAALLRSSQERAALRGRFIRGVRLRDLAAEARRRRRRHVVLSLVAGLLVAAIGTIISYGRDGVGLPDYLTAWLVLRLPTAARLFAVNGRGLRIWCDGLLAPGLYPAAAAYRLLEARLGHGCPAILLGLLFKATVGGVGVRLGLGRLEHARKAPQDGEGGYRLAGVEVPPGKECYHFLITGSPGSGKSTAIKDLLDQIRARGERAIVYDLSGEYVELYFRPDQDRLLNPLDGRTANWNVWAEIREDADFDALARSLFPPGGPEPFWADASAVLFSSVARALEPAEDRSNRRLYTALTADALDQLQQRLANTPAARLLDPSAGAMPSNLIATVTSRLQAWTLLPDGDGPVFSIRDFLEAPGDGWLFLSTGEQHAQVLKPLLSLWADIAVTTLLSRPPEASTARTFCVLDEVASLQRLPALPGLLERGRKHGAAVVLGLQAMPQLRDAYGRELAAAIAAQPQTWLVLRTVEPDTAKWLESALGHAEIEEVQESYSMGMQGRGGRESVSIHERVILRPVALAAEIASLPDHEGFLRVPGGQDVFRVVSSVKDRHRPSEAFVPRTGAKGGEN